MSITDYVSTRSAHLAAHVSKQSRADLISQPVCRLAACRVMPACLLMLGQTEEGARDTVMPWAAWLMSHFEERTKGAKRCCMLQVAPCT